MGQGSETLHDIGQEAEAFDLLSAAENSIRRERYGIAQAATKGTLILCPMCGKRFFKKTKGHTFCSNKGRRNCKDRYHNSMSDKRRERAKQWG